ncbi:MAG TPA: NAD(P)/FAD-dependent oxidoreductase [Candidatus Sulfotelmatobacter sp.]|jgi:flavin-dependent dehydrogenase|nr:NAD(P)/FAD-dependent oxidoreductase [Candidatus Sulfotelmatobacter sp.]
MSSREHAFVVGGGPAGLVAAIALRRKGLRVTVADGGDAPGDKACGEGILPTGLSALERLGIALDSAEGRAFRGIRFVNARTSADAVFPSRPGLGMRRIALHRQLARAAERAGVDLLWHAPASRVAEHHVFLGSKKFQADWVIGADGYHSRVRQWAGLAPRKNPSLRFAYRQHFSCKPWTDYVEVHWAAQAQLYITPVSDDEIGIVVLSRNSRLRVKDALQLFPRVAEKLRACETTTAERGAATGNLMLRAVHVGQVALLGDASGSVDAIAGEGLSLAFQQAEALADSIAQGNLAHYEAAHSRLRRRPLWVARQLLFLENYAWLEKRVLRAFASDRKLFQRMLAVHLGHASTFSSATAGAWLGWRLLAA